MKKTIIAFLKIANNQEKTQMLCQIVQDHFAKKDSILILAPSAVAVKYIDDLLWTFSKQSFLPHSSSQIISKDRIVITTLCQNLNKANILINLCGETCPIADEFNTIYELYEENHPEKRQQAEQRRQAYHEKGFVIKLS